MPRLFPVVVKRVSGAGTALVAWGPDFGESSDGNTFTEGTAVALTAVELESNQNVGEAITLTALETDYVPTTVGDNILLAVVETAYQPIINIGDTVAVSAVEIDYPSTINIGAGTVTLTALEATYPNTTVGCHSGGEVLGSPFWQTEAHTALTVPASSITVSVPSGTVDGDLLVALIYTNDTAAAQDINLPGGWTLINNRAQGAGFARAFRRIAASEPASYVFSFAGTVANATGEIHRIVGVDVSTPIDVSAVASVPATSLVTDPVCPLVSTTVVNCLVLAWAAHDHLAAAQTHTAPASHAEVADYESSTGTPATKIGSDTNWRVFAAIGSTLTATVDCTETVATANITMRIAIRPAATYLIAA